MNTNKYKVPKRETVGTDRQIATLMQLMLLWPQCSSTIAASFIKDTLGIVMTRACFQEVREALGLKEATHVLQTLKKKCQAELVILSLVEHHGVVGLSEQQFVSKVILDLKHCFGEDTNKRLVAKWVFDLLDHLKLHTNNLEDLKRAIVTARKNVQEMSILSIEKSRQTQLI